MDNNFYEKIIGDTFQIDVIPTKEGDRTIVVIEDSQGLSVRYLQGEEDLAFLRKYAHEIILTKFEPDLRTDHPSLKDVAYSCCGGVDAHRIGCGCR